MTFSRALLGLLLCGCAHAPASVTVTAALPQAHAPVTTPETEEDFGCSIYASEGIAENPATFRTCVERLVAAETPCEEGGSPDLATLELAVALIDGAGGPADIPRARTLLATCFADVSVQTVLEHADEKEKNPRAAPLGGCTAFAQTTFATGECLAEHTQNERAWLRRERRSYGSITRPLFDAATLAAAAWEEKLGAIEYARYAGGTMRGPAMQSRTLETMKLRRARLATIRAWAPRGIEDGASGRENFLNARRAILEDAEPEVVTAFEEEERAWTVYRGAEADLYEAIHPGTRPSAMIEIAAEHANALCSIWSDP